MIVTIVTLQNDSFTLEFDPEKTVAELKQEIHGVCGPDYVVEKQKLVYAGVYMDNERKLASYKVRETKFIVVMLSDDTVENPVDIKTLEERAIYAASAANANGHSQELPFEMELEWTDEPTNATASSHADFNLLMVEEYNRLVGNIVEMGYDMESVEQAMAASYNDPERAVEYLVNGFQSIGVGMMVESPMESLSDTSSNDATLAAFDSEANDDSPFNYFMEHPRFRELRSLVHGHPDLKQPVLDQIEASNPALFQLIGENGDAFNRMLFGETDNENQQAAAIDAEPPEDSEIIEIYDSENNDDEDQIVDAVDPYTMEQDHIYSQDDEEDSQVCLSLEDQNAINRLMALGFAEDLVLEAYFACNKNEQLAINFLLHDV